MYYYIDINLNDVILHDISNPFCEYGERQDVSLQAESDTSRFLADILPYTIYTTRITNIISETD